MTQPETTQPEKKRRGRKPRGVSMNRCSQCSKFVSMEPGEPEDEGLSINTEEGSEHGVHNITLNGTVRLALACAECGGDLAETTLEFEYDWQLEHLDECEYEDDSCIEEGSLDLESSEDSTGKGMYTKRFYGAAVSFKVSCNECGEKVEASCTETCQASFFEVT